MSSTTRKDATPTEPQMKLAIAQTLSQPFAYNAPVVILDFSVNDQGEFEGKFKDATRPRIFSFNIKGQSVTFKPYTPGRMDSVDDWEEFSSGYSYRVDAGIGGNKKPQCVKPTAYNCGKACINIMKSCKIKTDDPTIKDRLKNLEGIGKNYAKTVEATPKVKAEKPPVLIPELKPEPKKTNPVVEKQQPTSLIGDGTHDGAPKNAQEYYDAVTKTGKQITLKEAQDTANTIKYWTGKGSSEIREDQKNGRENKQADQIDEFIKNSTPYKGEIYRGITFSSEDEAMKWAKGDKDGIVGNQSAHSSWTSDIAIAAHFTELDFSGEKSTQVIIKSTNKSGASIRNLSVFGKPEAGKLGRDEKEVVVSKNTRHKFKGVTKKDGILYVEVEEVDFSNDHKEGTEKATKEPKQKIVKTPKDKPVPSETEAIESSTIGDGSHASTPKNAKEYYSAMKKAGKEITLQEAKDVVKSIKDWVFSSNDVRSDQQNGKFNQQAEDITSYIKNSTPYKGEIYRGLNFPSEDEAMKWIKEDGHVLDNQSAHASWTSDPDTAISYAKNSGTGFGNKIKIKKFPVIIRSVNKTGASIDNIATPNTVKSEKEVIVSQDTRHKVKKIIREKGYIFVEVEEV